MIQIYLQQKVQNTMADNGSRNSTKRNKTTKSNKNNKSENTACVNTKKETQGKAIG